MPIDGLMIRAITGEMQKLQGARVDKVNQPEKDAILLLLRTAGENNKLYISANANHARFQLTDKKLENPQVPPGFCMVLRKHLGGARLLEIEQSGLDRVVAFTFDTLGELGDPEKKHLIVEIMGRHSNIILCDENGKIIDAIRHVGSHMSRFRQVLPGREYASPPPQDKQDPFAMQPEQWQEMLQKPGRFAKILQEQASGIAPATAREITHRILGDIDARTDASIPETPEHLQRFFAQFDSLRNPTVCFNEDKPQDVFPMDIESTAFTKRHFATISEALDAFFQQRDMRERMAQRSGALQKLLKNHQDRCQRKIALQMQAVMDTENMEQARIKGELITSYQHMLKKGDTRAVLPNFYADEEEMEIALDPLKTPNENAQAYFKRYQKMKNASIIAVEQLKLSREELRTVEELLLALEQIQTEGELAELREEAMQAGLVRATHTRRKERKHPPSKPLHYTLGDMDIYVGKNNTQNDRLTQSARPEWAWLHVKDIPGSHVIVQRDIADISEEELLLCAKLAAWHSKGKNSSSVPVDIVQRKYVRKPSGAKPGYVIFSRQRTVYVQPDAELFKTIIPDEY